MTTKHKIIAGFLLMMGLLAGIATLGYNSLENSSTGFTEYRRLARLNLATSDMETYLTRAAYNAYRFLDTRSPEFMKKAQESMDGADKKISESLEFTVKPERKKVLSDLAAGSKTLRSQLIDTESSVQAGYKQYSDVVQANVRLMGTKLVGMGKLAQGINNTEALFAITEVWEDLAATRSSLSRFAESRMQADADRTRENFVGVNEGLDHLRTAIHLEEARKLLDEVMQAYTAMHDAFLVMEKQNAHAEKVMADMEANLETELRSSNKLSTEVNDQMLEYGTVLLKSNAASQQQTLMISLIGLVLGAVFAAFIILGIIRVLTDLAGFAAAVARGDFTHKIKTQEKGEIGSMVGAMLQIPTVLEKVIQDGTTLANAILSGHFRNRLDASTFNGSFAELAQSVNAVGNAYTNVMDSLPQPIIASDRNNKAIFLNQNAQSAIGSNLAGQSGSSQAKAGEPKADSYGAAAMSRNAMSSGEAIIHPQGKRMDISVTALPLQDMNRAVVGYMEIVTDLTEIRGQQATMMHVARDASEISDRVAAASEQLAAQVEQISRGAEMQRARVESTASAMTEMNSTVLEVARSAGQASEQSEGTREKAEAGAGLVNKVVQSINTVNAVAVTLQDNMQELGKQAESIGGVMNVISDIADQTNLLALNAAIEAARAGEAGRGFAVVADEVRKLAEKTMTATQEVGTSINAIQNSARNNISEVGNAVKSINEATGLANSSGTALKEIVDLAAANSAVVASIATAAEEQSATSEEINRAIEEINQVVGETTDGMVQSSDAVQDLSRMAQELRRVMDKLR